MNKISLGITKKKKKSVRLFDQKQLRQSRGKKSIFKKKTKTGRKIFLCRNLTKQFYLKDIDKSNSEEAYLK